MATVKGYKVLQKNMLSPFFDFLYNTTDTFVHEGEVKLGEGGFHFCTDLQEVLFFYAAKDMRVFEIEASGTIIDESAFHSTHVCSQIKLVRELSLEEVKNSINKPEPAYLWASRIGDVEQMKPLFDALYAKVWIMFVNPTDKQYFIDKGLIVD